MASFDPLSAAFEIGGKLLDRFFPDPTKKAEAALELEKMRQSGELAVLASQTSLAQGQIAINVEEAKSANWFVAGWRPAVGWICALALAYAAILEPTARFVAKVAFAYAGEFPVIDTMLTLQILMGMLGLGGLRSFEKGKGVAR